MIVTKTPLRVSFFGGGSDIPDFYEHYKGMVVSTTIDKYIQLAVNICKTDHTRVIYSEMEVALSANEIKHDRVRSALQRFNIKNNIEICSFSDVPTKGTGLGSSSTFTVGLVNALYNMHSRKYNKKDLAETACEIEIKDCKQPIGKQDQYAATYGGFNVIRFDHSGVEVTSINVSSGTLMDLNNNMLCFSTGIFRQASGILGKQVDGLQKGSNIEMTKTMVSMAERSTILLRKGKIDDFGAMLHDSWEIKKKLAANISNPQIDDMYEIARENGALGGKILGAGGGGYLLLYVQGKNKLKLMRAMQGYRPFHFNFTDTGSTAISL